MRCFVPSLLLMAQNKKHYKNISLLLRCPYCIAMKEEVWRLTRQQWRLLWAPFGPNPSCHFLCRTFALNCLIPHACGYELLVIRSSFFYIKKSQQKLLFWALLHFFESSHTHKSFLPAILLLLLSVSTHYNKS